METKKNALTINNLNFKFNNKEEFFFKDLYTEFEENKVHFIQGQNGIGKSTLFRILQGNIHKHEVASGEICLPTNTCYQLSKKNKQELHNFIKIVVQKFDQMLASQFTFAQNLSIANVPLHPLLKPLPNYKPLPKLIENFNINIHKQVKFLSGGQRQILAILMVLQKMPSILLMDEPTAALDDKNSKMVMNFLFELVKMLDLTIIIICHDKEIVQQYAKDGFFEMLLNDETKERRMMLRKR